MFSRAAISSCAAAIFFLSGFSACSAAHDDGQEAAVKPKILLMTSLPIIWGDGASMSDIVSGEILPAPIYRHWRDRYDMDAVDSLAGLANSDTDIILLAQPRAMDPADLSDLDSWVRAGGRALIFTDPALLWHSDLPLGDSGRPLASGLLSPLLDHWGLQLVAPNEEGEGIAELTFRDYTMTTGGIGSFAKVTDNASQHADCVLSDANLIAQCELDKGQVILVADADFMDETFWADEPEWKEGGKANAMRFADDLIGEFQLNLPVSKD